MEKIIQGGSVTLLFKNGQLGKIKGKVVAGSTTTRPDYPLTYTWSSGISRKQSGVGATYVNGTTAGHWYGWGESSSYVISAGGDGTVYVPMFCDDFESLKTCTISGGTITYTSWLEV